MKTITVAILHIFLLLSAVICQTYDEEYTNVNCQYQWIATVCDCENVKSLMRLPKLHGNIRNIHVKNCENIFIAPGSIDDLPDLVGLTFENVGELKLQEFSFNSTRDRRSVRFQIINSTVPRLPAHFIKGHLEEVIIKDSTVFKIETFAFTGFFSEISAIKISNSTIEEIEPQAFKKLSVRDLEITDSTFQTNSASRTFYDCHIQNVIIEGSRFTMLQSSTFDVKEVQRLRIQNSTFGVIEGEAFMMDVSDRAIFSDNNVTMMNHGAFRGITMNPKTPNVRTQEVYFEFNNNHIDFIHPEQDVLFCPDMKLQVSKLYLGDPRNCDAVGRLNEKTFFNDNANSIFMRIEDQNFESISYLSDRCRTESSWFWMLLIILAVVVLLLILIPAIFCYLRNKRKLDIIMPEPRTYRQTQIVMQVETHGLIKTDF